MSSIPSKLALFFIRGLWFPLKITKNERKKLIIDFRNLPDLNCKKSLYHFNSNELQYQEN
jgi:hypothetical protein